MKILISSTAYPPYINGVTTATANLAQALSTHHSIAILSATDSKQPQVKSLNHHLKLFLFPGVNFKLRSKLTVPYPYPKKIKTIIQTFKPDIIHLQDFSPLGLSALSVAHELHIPIIFTHHFTAEFIVKTIITNKALSHKLSQNLTTQQLIYRLVNLFYNQCQLVTVPNQNLIPYFKAAKLKTPIISISNGIITQNFTRKIKLSQIIKQYRLTGTKIILFVGRLDADKNLEILIEAFKSIHRQNPDTNLIIVGQGNQKSQLVKQVKQSQLESCVRFLPPINNQSQALSHLYNAACLFVNPSIIENQSVSFIEAFAAGLPIVSADHSLQRNFIRPNQNGLVAESNNPAAFAVAIQKLLSDQKLYQQISRHNRRTAKQYDISITSQKYLSAYRSLLT
ncbi:MAG: glycosyltransferase [Patescibacteria group bacterium]|nr:glycosyltransferase [Patescibacteria group bacterium]